jgi:anti-sigma B factor antagonist
MDEQVFFRYEMVESQDEQTGAKVTTVRCHGRMASENTREMSEQVKALIPLGGRILIDLGDVSYLDSSALGGLVGLKVSAVNQNFCELELVNMAPRVIELMRITKVMQLFS